MSGRKVAVVTGGNRGIGLSIVKGLSSKFDGDVILTARKPSDGEQAVKDFSKARAKVLFHQLDVTDESSVRELANFLKDKYGGLDVLVNNAGFAFSTPVHGSGAEVPFEEQARVTVDINYFGLRKVCDALFPLLRKEARVVNLSSWAGWIKEQMPADTPLKRELTSKDLTVNKLDQIMKAYVAAAKRGDHKKMGWPSYAYFSSKIGVSALTIVQQREFDKRPDRDLVVNHVHPGYVKTGMTGGKGYLSPDEGARSSIYAALLPPKTKIRGEFIYDDCSVKKWA